MDFERSPFPPRTGSDGDDAPLEVVKVQSLLGGGTVQSVPPVSRQSEGNLINDKNMHEILEKITVGLPASKLGGVLPKGDMLLRELLLLLVLGMCFGVVVDKLFLLTGGGRDVTLSSASSSLM